MTITEDTHYVLHCKVEKVTKLSELKAHGDMRPTSCTKTEKERSVTEVFNLALSKRDLKELLDLACAAIKLMGTTNGQVNGG